MTQNMKRFVSFLWGAALFTGAQLYLLSLWDAPPDWHGDNMGWFLNSFTGLSLVTAVLAIGAFGLAILTKEPLSSAWAMPLGATFALTVILFAIGDGSMWPIVIVLGAVFTSLGVGGGLWLGLALKKFTNQPSAGRS